MTRECKTCKSTLRPEIDKMIVEGAKFTDVEKWCVAKGLAISSASLVRHANAHIEGYTPKPTNQIVNISEIGDLKFSQNEPNPLSINLSEIRKTFKCPESIESSKDLKKTVATFTKKIVGDLLPLIYKKIELYSQGMSKLPSDEIRALKDIVSCCEIITKKNYDRSGDNVFDVDTALEVDNSYNFETGRYK